MSLSRKHWSTPSGYLTLWQRIVNGWHNLSVYWSPHEAGLQAAVAHFHGRMGEQLMKTTGDIEWGPETDSFEDG